MRTATITAIYEAARKDKRIYFLTGDYGKAYEDMFKKDIPNQCLNAGMAEQNLIGMAAGLALSGMKVFVYSIVPFVTLRCFEQIKVDVAYQNLDVTIVGTGGGFVYGSCGPTHYSIEDIAAIRALPNMKVIAPANPMEARLLTDQILKVGGPAYIRLNKAKESNPEREYSLEFGKGFVAKEGKDITLISTGAILADVLRAAALLDVEGLSTEVVHMHTIKPLDADLVRNRAKRKRGVFTIEEHNVLGGLGGAVAEVFAEAAPQGVVFKRFGAEDAWPHVVGTQKFLRDCIGISAEKLAVRISRLMKNN